MTIHTTTSRYADPALHAQGLFIGGRWEPGAGIPVLDPSTGRMLAEVPESCPVGARDRKSPEHQSASKDLIRK